MSVYSKKGKGWRYDFMVKGVRYTQAGFKTKTEAKQAAADRRKEVLNPTESQTLTDMEFSELVNLRLDHIEAYNSKSHYADYCSRAQRWIKLWHAHQCNEITPDMIQQFILKRSQVSPYTANKDLKSLRSLFNFGKRKLKRFNSNPADDIDFLPVEEKLKYIPPLEDVFQVIAAANPDTQDYLWTIRETMARVSEVNKLTWDDVDLSKRFVVLYTRKRKGGDLTPRKVPMTERLYKILSRRHVSRDRRMPWVFWHSYVSSRNGERHEGPYDRRKRLMKGLCKKAGVKYFNFHSLRHSGASVMDNSGVPIGSIQRILGHTNRKTTELYLQSLGESEREAMSVFEEASRNSHTIHTQQTS